MSQKTPPLRERGERVARRERGRSSAPLLAVLVLGILHARATPLAPGDRKGLSPRDPHLAESMQATTLLLTRRTDIWLAWVGFNLSHSLGAVAFAAFVLAVGLTPRVFAAASSVCEPLVKSPVRLLYTVRALVTGAYGVFGAEYDTMPLTFVKALPTESTSGTLLVPWLKRFAISWSSECDSAQ